MSDKQPENLQSGTQPLRVTPPPKRGRIHKNKRPTDMIVHWLNRYWKWALITLLALLVAVIAGGAAGFYSGSQRASSAANISSGQNATEQFDLGVKDLEAGNFEIARQRFEFVIKQNPSYPGVTEKLAQVMQILAGTATVPPQTPTTAAITPTPDNRPVDELIKQTTDLVAKQDWSGILDTVNSIRKANPNYQVTRVDDLIYLALVNRGNNKILRGRDLEGGTYDLALAERFGPLDADSSTSRDWARLYMIGSSFWEAIPEQAVYYFGQLAAAAPGLSDASGITAKERYAEALVQYGDELAAKQDWCNAQKQYELSLATLPNDTLQATATNAATQCLGPTATTIISTTETATATPLVTAPVAASPTATLAAPTAPLPTTTSAPQPSATIAPSATLPEPSQTSQPASATPEASATPQPATSEATIPADTPQAPLPGTNTP